MAHSVNITQNNLNLKLQNYVLFDLFESMQMALIIQHCQTNHCDAEISGYIHSSNRWISALFLLEGGGGGMAGGGGAEGGGGRWTAIIFSHCNKTCCTKKPETTSTYSLCRVTRNRQEWVASASSALAAGKPRRRTKARLKVSDIAWTSGSWLALTLCAAGALRGDEAAQTKAVLKRGQYALCVDLLQ